MSFFNKIKSMAGGSREQKKSKNRTVKPEKVSPVSGIPLEGGKASKTGPIKPISKKKNLKDIYKILREPHISEKATFLSDQNKYVFKVFKATNKIQIKNAVVNLYGVAVRDVRIINEKSKSRKVRNVSGHKPGYKKAIVTLEKGYKIEILPH